MHKEPKLLVVARFLRGREVLGFAVMNMAGRMSTLMPNSLAEHCENWGVANIVYYKRGYRHIFRGLPPFRLEEHSIQLTVGNQAELDSPEIVTQINTMKAKVIEQYKGLLK